ncbi:DEAD/DEAH box helicase [Rhizosphaericola mali]|uniref:DEAD/DEAH box helicase n=1 Tax=Rhizosphaericola mali TaxID=2545455 RepID=A0A5P2G6H9_9BACT|nr:DEAD/DEAH box helicase [Rhizosphaericola mali]QES88833.1 DEAD/DEAH box helicase [Rhizosphaericola mali]
MFLPRPYQSDSINLGIIFLTSSSFENEILILPTGAGKSIVIAKILEPLDGKTLILQPSKEILEQNYAKYISSGNKASIYSASAGQKEVSNVTFATIGSVINKKHLFNGVKYILIDECHLVNPETGMYQEFLNSFPNAKVLGLTATPYRLTTGSEGAMLEFITRTSPRIFSKVLGYVQTKVLFDAGYLSKLEYYSFSVIDRSKLTVNSSGSDFTEASLKRYYKAIDMPSKIAGIAKSILSKKTNLLIFCSLLEEAISVSRKISGSVILTGDTKTLERERILAQFKAGKIKCLINVGVLTTGFDYPALEAVLIARSTMSLALYYQIIGRVMRICPGKESAWVVDMGGNINFFGKIETMEIREVNGLYSVWNNGRQLTNVPFQK